MPWYSIVILCVFELAALYFIFAAIVAKIVLKQATRPPAHTFAEARERQHSAEHVSFYDYDNVWQKQSFSIDGLQGKVCGEVVFNPADANNTRHKVAIFCHGHTWNRLNSIKYATIFYNAGYNLVLYDHASFGESEGTYTTLGYFERRDLSGVIDYAQKVFGKDCFVALHGESMGAATALGVLDLRDDVNLVIADCSYSKTMAYYRELCPRQVHLPSFPIVDFANMESKYKMKYDFKAFNPIDCVKVSQTPICFIHGTDDQFILPHNSEDMFAATKNKLSELHLIHGAGHARSFRADNAAYTQIVLGFLAKVEQCTDLTK